MNKFILIAMNPSKYTKEELKANADAAAYVAFTTAYVAFATASEADAITLAAEATYRAAYYTFLAVSSAEVAEEIRAKDWISRYFELTGEDEKEYLDEINKG